MSRLLETIELYKEENKRLSLGINEDLLEKVTRGLGPSIYSKDASTVAGSDDGEIETVVNNYLVKKLGLEKADNMMDTVKEVLEKLGSSNRNKYRALVYAMLCEKYGKEEIYN